MQWGVPWGGGIPAIPEVPRAIAQTPDGPFDGKWGTSAGAALVGFAQISEHSFWGVWLGFWGSAGFAPELWRVTASDGGSAPLPVLVEAPVSNAVLTITCDQPFRPGLRYDVTPQALLAGLPVDPFWFVGSDVSRTSTPELDLLDLEASPFEPQRVTAGGDHGMAAGFITWRKLHLDALLTVRGSVAWGPSHGSELPHKGLRPTDLAGEASRIRELLSRIPGTLSVDVQLTWDAGELVAVIDARGEAGVLQEEVRI